MKFMYLTESQFAALTEEEFALLEEPTEILSIRERIERRLAAIVRGISGIGRVFRWDMRGPRDPDTELGVDSEGKRPSMQHLDALIAPDDESAAEDGQGGMGGGTTTKTLPVEIFLKLAQDETHAMLTARLINRWLLRLETALMADPVLQEAAGECNEERLAVSMRTVAIASPPIEFGQREVMVGIRVEVTYMHYRDDPAAGPGVTHYEELEA